jgi:MFS family permease
LLDSIPRPAAPQTRRILFASLIGTTIEFFDFYIYATAAVLVFPKLFFPKSDPTTAMLQSFATFALAFFARPVGLGVVRALRRPNRAQGDLGHRLADHGRFDRADRLAADVFVHRRRAAFLLALCRLGQGLGLGGEWGGAVLLATENAPPGKHGWYGMFPQLGAPLGFLCSTGAFLLMTNTLTEAQLFSWGWRLPFLASAALVLVGLYIRLQLVETPAFKRSLAQGERVRVPFLVVFAKHPLRLVLGTLGATCTFVVFYLMTVFALGWATSSLGFGRQPFLILQMIGVLFFGLTIPLAGLMADRIGGRVMLMIATVLIIAFGFVFEALFSAHNTANVLLFLVLGFAAERLDVRPLGQRSGNAVSHRRPLYGHLIGVQFRGNTRSLARAVDCHLAGVALRHRLCGVLSVGGRAGDLDRLALDQKRRLNNKAGSAAFGGHWK